MSKVDGIYKNEIAHVKSQRLSENYNENKSTTLFIKVETYIKNAS